MISKIVPRPRPIMVGVSMPALGSGTELAVGEETLAIGLAVGVLVGVAVGLAPAQTQSVSAVQETFRQRPAKQVMLELAGQSLS